MWIKIEIVSLTPEQVEVMVTHANDDPLFMSRIDRMMREIVECWPIVHVKISHSSTEGLTPDRAPDKRYRTAPLKGLWTHMQGGFFHDGRFATLRDVVDHYNTFFNLGLIEPEINDLIEYLKSL